MAKVVDPDTLALIVNASATTEEVEIQTDAKTIKITLVGDVNDDSPGSTSGVTKQCLYSFLKEEWRTNTTLNKFKFSCISWMRFIDISNFFVFFCGFLDKNIKIFF